MTTHTHTHTLTPTHSRTGRNFIRMYTLPTSVGFWHIGLLYAFNILVFSMRLARCVCFGVRECVLVCVCDGFGCVGMCEQDAAIERVARKGLRNARK